MQKQIVLQLPLKALQTVRILRHGVFAGERVLWDETTGIKGFLIT
jgi:hypothetical protein